MAQPYSVESWRELFLMIGTTAGALIGLLFVVTSLHLDQIVKNPVYRVRARNNSFYLLVLVVESAAVLTPQPPTALGVELLVISLSLLQLHARIISKFYFKDRSFGRRGGFSIATALLFVGSRIVGSIGGALIIAGQLWGLYLEAVCCLLNITSIVLNAWTIMLGVGEGEDGTTAQ